MLRRYKNVNYTMGRAVGEELVLQVVTLSGSFPFQWLDDAEKRRRAYCFRLVSLLGRRQGGSAACSGLKRIVPVARW